MSQKPTTKIFAILGMVVSALSFLCAIGSLVTIPIQPENEAGISISFGLWIYSAILGLLACFPYGIDALLCLGKAVRRQDTVFNGVLAAVLLLGFPMSIYVGGALGLGTWLWNIYHIAMVVLEIISFRRRWIY